MLSFAALTANASILGATANVEFYYPNISSLYCNSGTAVVGAGIEYAAGCSGFGAVSIDLGANSISVNLVEESTWANSSFNGFELDVFGFDLLDVVYSGGTMAVTGISEINGDVWLNFAGQAGGIANFTFRDNGSQVPEPASLALFSAGLLGLAASRRKRVVRN